MLPGATRRTRLAERMGIEIGDEFTLVSLSQGSSLSDLPQMMKFIMQGTLKTGFHDLDNNYVYISVPSAQKLVNMPNPRHRLWFKTTITISPRCSRFAESAHRLSLYR
jgi:ABC-type lipoprotein release transport system permease subunit